MMQTLVTTLSAMLSFHRANKLQAFFVLLGLTLGVALFTSVNQINSHAKSSYAEADQLLGAGARFKIIDQRFTDVSVADYIALRRAGFTSVYPVIDTRLPADNNILVNIVATDLLALPLSQTDDSSSLDNPFSGESWSRLVQPPYQAWFPPHVAARFGLRDGDRLVLRDGRKLPPTVIKNQTQQGDRVFMDIGAAFDSLNRGTFSYLAASNISASDKEKFKERFSDRLSLVHNTDAIDLDQVTKSLHTNLSALGLLSFVVGVFIVFSTVQFSLHTRQQTISVLSDLGVSPSIITGAISIEALLWSALGTISGVSLAQPLSQTMMPAVAATLQNIYGASVSSATFLQLEQFAHAFAITLVGSTLAFALPLWRSIHNSSVVLPADTHEVMSGEQRLVAVGFFMLIGAGVLYSSTVSVFQGFVILSLVLFGGILLLPTLIALQVLICKRLTHRNWLISWALADVILQLPHLRISMMALMMTLVANIGVTSLVGSFRIALEDWLETRLSADIFIESTAINKSDLLAESWVSSVYQRRTQEIRFAGRKATIIGFPPQSPDFTQDTIIDPIPNAFMRWRAPDGKTQIMFANEQVRYLAGIETGDSVKLSTPKGEVEFVIAGFFHDYGNPKFAFYLTDEQMSLFFPYASPQSWGVWVQPGQLDNAELRLTELGVNAESWISQANLRTLSLSIFDRTFAITRSLNSLTLLVAAVALLAALLALNQHRRPEYGFWSVIGANWRQFLVVTGFPVFLMTLVVMIASLPLGLALSWLLINKINVIAFGWTMPLVIGTNAIAFLYALVLMVTVVVFCIAALSQHRSLQNSFKKMTTIK